MNKRTNSILKGKFVKECSRVGGVADYIYVTDFDCDIDEKNGEFTVKSITIGDACGNSNHAGERIFFSKPSSLLKDLMPKNLYVDNYETGRGYVMFFNPETNDFEDGQTSLFGKFLANFAPALKWHQYSGEKKDMFYNVNRWFIAKAA